jgi:hypothetical protein
MQRFKFQGGRLMKAGDGRNGDGWFATEAEAREWARPKPRGATIPASISAPFDWNRKWMAVKSDLRALGFTGDTKAEAIDWAHENDVEGP